MFKNNNVLPIKSLVLSAFFIALQVVFSRMLSVNTPFLRIGFGFLPLALCSVVLGPWIGGGCAAASDIIGGFLFSTGPFFPGFTISAFLAGIFYGLFLHKREIKVVYVLIPVIIECIVINLLLNTYWLSILMHKGYIGLLPARIIKNLLMIPIEATMILFFEKTIMKHLKIG